MTGIQPPPEAAVEAVVRAALAEDLGGAGRGGGGDGGGSFGAGQGVGGVGGGPGGGGFEGAAGGDGGGPVVRGFEGAVGGDGGGLVRFSSSADVTSAAVVPAGAVAEGVVVAREAGVVAGLGVAARVFAAVGAGAALEPLCRDGEAVGAGAPVARVRGPARDVLAAERTALNLLGRLSGIATATSRFVAAVGGTGASILDTRKTTPGLRALEKYAVRCGGGVNHRMGLFDAVLIKDNHIAVAGGVGAAVRAARAAVGRAMVVEVEADTLDQVRDAVEAGPDVILLDNMDAAALREAVAVVGSRARTEASGGMDLESARRAAEAGVDFVSVGAITHSARQLDLSMEMESRPAKA